MTDATVRRSGAGVPLALAAGVLPLLALSYQVAAAMTARSAAGARDLAGWLLAASASPWFALLIGSEILSFAIWTAVLARLPLARAFPLTATGYVLVVAAGPLILHQPLSRAAVIGSGAILAGAALLATDAT